MYERDLAHVHDDGFGILARALTDAGYEVLGVDVSAPLLDIARERVPEARFVHGSLHDSELPRSTAITAVGEILGYAGIDRGLLERLHAAIEPGGLLVFDAPTPGREGPEPRRAWHEGDGWLLCMEARADESTLTRAITTFTRTEDGSWRRSDETHTLTLYEPDQLTEELRAAGFADARGLRADGRAGRRGRRPTARARCRSRSR